MVDMWLFGMVKPPLSAQAVPLRGWLRGLQVCHVKRPVDLGLGNHNLWEYLLDSTWGEGEIYMIHREN